MTAIEFIASVMVFLAAGSGPLALVMQVVKARSDSRARQDDLTKQRTLAEFEKDLTKLKTDSDDRKRSDELSSGLADLLGKSFNRIDVLTVAIGDQTGSLTALAASVKAATSLEEERLRVQESEGIENRRLLRDQAQTISGISPALNEGFKTITTSIAETHSQSVKTVVEKIQNMTEELSKKIEPVDNHIAEQKALIVELKTSIDALTKVIGNMLETGDDHHKETLAAVQQVHLEIKALTERLDTLK